MVYASHSVRQCRGRMRHSVRRRPKAYASRLAWMCPSTRARLHADIIDMEVVGRLASVVARNLIRTDCPA